MTDARDDLLASACQQASLHLRLAALNIRRAADTPARRAVHLSVAGVALSVAELELLRARVYARLVAAA